VKNRRSIARRGTAGDWHVTETWRTVSDRRVLCLVLWRVEDDYTAGPIVHEAWMMGWRQDEPARHRIYVYRDRFTRERTTTADAELLIRHDDAGYARAAQLRLAQLLNL
jgi:hypothetical protein